MKLIIDIDDEMVCNDIKYKALEPTSATDEVIINALYNGTPYEERPIGHWKDHRWCSNCGCGIPTDVYGTSITEEEAHFCVECGARMEAEND